jgi:hypothetical protein
VTSSTTRAPAEPSPPLLQVLESCSALLETTQIPVDGIVRLLQHILRPHQQELQQWAAHLLQVSSAEGEGDMAVQAAVGCSAGAAAQQQPCRQRPCVVPLVHSPAALPCCSLAPHSSSATISTAAPLGPAPSTCTPAATTTRLPALTPPPPLCSPQGPGLPGDDPTRRQETQAAVQELLKMLKPPAAGTSASAAAGQEQALAGTSGRIPAYGGSGQQQQKSSGGRGGKQQRGQQQLVPQQQALQAPQQQAVASAPLSLERDWDWDLVPEASAAGRRKGKAGPKAGKAAAAKAGGARREKSRRERYLDVEAFWRSASKERRRELLRVPLSALLEGQEGQAGCRREAGAAGAGPSLVEDVVEGLVLLREHSNRHARFWLCPACDQKFHSSADFLNHLELYHEVGGCRGLNAQRGCVCCGAVVLQAAASLLL